MEMLSFSDVCIHAHLIITIIFTEKWPRQSVSHYTHIHMYISWKRNTRPASILSYLGIIYTGPFVQNVNDPNVILSLCIGPSNFHHLLSTGTV